MSIQFSAVSLPSSLTSVQRSTTVSASGTKIAYPASAVRSFSVASNPLSFVIDGNHVPYGSASKFCRGFCEMRLWILKNLNLGRPNGRCEQGDDFESLQIQDKNDSSEHVQTTLLHEGQDSERRPAVNLPNGSTNPIESAASLSQIHSYSSAAQGDRAPSLCIAVIGATGELARRKIFPALFALYYSGFLPENVGIFGYSRKNLTDEDLRSMIASNLTCRIDHRLNCGDKMDAFLNRTYYLNGGYDNVEGMSKLHARMELIEGETEANRIFYLSVPQEALPDVASSLADNAQTHKGWTRIIIEKPFGLDLLSSNQLTRSLLFKFQEEQLYRIDHLLGRNIIENLTVLRFSNLIFQPLWSRTYIRNIQIILSEEDLQTQGR